MAAIVLLCAGCGGSDELPPKASSDVSVSLPRRAPLSAAEALAQTQSVLRTSDGPAEVALPDPIPASVFLIDRDMPDPNNALWQRIRDQLAQLRPDVVRFGWDVYLDGYTDTIGDAQYNQHLSERRARGVGTILVSELGYPNERIHTAGHGVLGPNPDDRKVTVTFRRNR